MSIIVVCSHCQARLRVPEEFAGQQKRCPKCKELIAIPAAIDDPLDVQIYEPEPDEAALKKKKRAGIKPIIRVETKINPAALGGIAAATVLPFAVAWLLRGVTWKSSGFVLGFSAIGLAPPCVLAGYSILRNPELEPNRDSELAVRVMICAAVYAVLWAVLWGLKSWLLAGESITEGWSVLLLLAPTMTIGTFTAWGTLELDPGSGFFHYCLYLGVCVLLRLTLGLAPL